MHSIRDLASVTKEKEGAHGDYLDAKYARLKQEAAPAPFIDPAGYKQYGAGREQAFRAELAKQGG
jgi:hypothetical protein